MIRVAGTIFILLLLTGSMYSQNDWRLVSGDREKTAWAKNETALAPPFVSTVHTIPQEWADGSPQTLTHSRGVAVLGYQQGTAGPNRVVAFDLNANTVLWADSIRASKGGFGGTPSIADDHVLSGGQGGDAPFTCFSRTTGDVVWTRDMGSQYGRSISIDGNRCYVLSDSIYCINIADGTTIWSGFIGGWSDQTTPAADNTNIFVASRDTVWAFDKMTGDLNWKTAGCTGNALSVDESTVYVTDTASVRALDKSNGQEVWKHQVEGGVSILYPNCFALDERHLVYVLDYNKNSVGEVVCLNKSEGVLLWSHAFEGERIYTPSIANGYIYVIDWWTKTLWGFDIENGDVAFKDESRSYRWRPVISEGSLYALTSADIVVEFTPDLTDVRSLPQAGGITLDVYPNPVRAHSIVAFTLPHRAEVSLEVYTVLGQSAATIHSGIMNAGRHSIALDASGLAGLETGLYYVLLRWDGGYSGTNIAILQ